MFKYTVTCALAAALASASHTPAPTYHPAPAPTYHAAPVAYKDETPKPYTFEYGVSDSYKGVNFNQHENSDASTVTGSYSVLLPDGRTQTVTYTADASGYGGYIADVKYEGYAAPYEAPKQTYKPAPAPVYHAAPAPVYHPAPATVYKPAPAPVYKPAPAPVYKPAPTYHA